MHEFELLDDAISEASGTRVAYRISEKEIWSCKIKSMDGIVEILNRWTHEYTQQDVESGWEDESRGLLLASNALVQMMRCIDAVDPAYFLEKQNFEIEYHKAHATFHDLQLRRDHCHGCEPRWEGDERLCNRCAPIHLARQYHRRQVHG